MKVSLFLDNYQTELKKNFSEAGFAFERNAIEKLATVREATRENVLQIVSNLLRNIRNIQKNRVEDLRTIIEEKKKVGSSIKEQQAAIENDEKALHEFSQTMDQTLKECLALAKEIGINL